MNLIVSVAAIVVAVVIGGWQIYLAYDKLKGGRASSVGHQLATGQAAPAVDGAKVAQDSHGGSRASDDWTRPSPKEIIQQIDDLPLAQQAAASKTYQGLKVTWRVSLHSTYDRRGKSRLMTLDNDHFPWVYFDIDASSHPEIMLSKKGRFLRVTGVIAEVNAGEIILEDVAVTLED